MLGDFQAARRSDPPDVLAELKRRQSARTRAAKAKTSTGADPDKYKREVRGVDVQSLHFSGAAVAQGIVTWSVPRRCLCCYSLLALAAWDVGCVCSCDFALRKQHVHPLLAGCRSQLTSSACRSG